MRGVTHRRAATQWSVAANLLLMLLGHAIEPGSVCAFQLWSNRLTKALGGSNWQDLAASTNNGRHHQTTITTSKTPQTTTTTTTTQMPPFELHFEINPAVLEPYDNYQQDLNASNKLTEQQVADGTLILEDLVNQFERNVKLDRARLREPQEDAPLSSSPSVDQNELDPREFDEPQHEQQQQQQQQQNFQTISSLHTRNRSAPYTMRGETTERITNASRVPDGADERVVQNLKIAQAGVEPLVDTLYSPEMDPDRHIQYDTSGSSLVDRNPLDEDGLPADIRRSDHKHEWNAKEAPPISTRTTAPISTHPEVRNHTATTLSKPPIDNLQHQVISPLIQISTMDINGTSGLDSAHSSANHSSVQQVNSSSPIQDATVNQMNLRSASQAQARSMSGVSSRMPQHSKAPYAASYSLFNQRPSDPNWRPPNTTTPSPANQGAAVAAQQNNTATMHANKLETNVAPSNSSELVNSISKISSHLVGEASRDDSAKETALKNNAPMSNPAPTTSTTTSTSTTTTPQPMTVFEHLQAYLNSDGQNKPNDRLDQHDILQRVASKLAPTNTLVDLEPLPSTYQGGDEAAFDTSNAHNQQRRNSHNDRYAASPGELELNSLGVGQLSSMDLYQQAGAGEQANQMGAVTDRAPTTVQPQLTSFITERAQDLRSVVSSLMGTDAALMQADSGDSSNNMAASVPILHRKTLELLSNQIKNSDSNLLTSGASGNTLAIHQHRERSPPVQRQLPVSSSLQALNRGVSGSGGTFAASLINVTAPMTMPLSASEAMEAHTLAALGKNQGQDGASMGTSHRLHGNINGLSPHRSSYYAPASPPSPVMTGSSQVSHDSIYSRPMNQFKPTLSLPHNANERDALESNLSASERDRLRLGENHPLTGSQLASGFRSPLNQYQPVGAQNSMMASSRRPPHFGPASGLPTPSSYLQGLEASSSAGSGGSGSTMATASSSQPSMTTLPASASNNKFMSSTPATPSNGLNRESSNGRPGSLNPGKQQLQNGTTGDAPAITNGFITGSVVNTTMPASQIDLMQAATTGGVPSATTPGSVSSQVLAGGAAGQQQGSGSAVVGGSKRVFNLTRVEHISAECSNDLIRTIIIFNGTFKGIIYSSGYVRDPNCLYINGTGKTRYDFSIRLNQCGTLGRQELHSPSGPDEVRRRDQVMWNSLSIQYNPIIEQEWDEHFRVSCEYGSDFWKTISFSPFNVETNTGSPVVFTVDPPQCQMEILKGHSMVGPRQEAISGPVTVGDPLTLLIHMKSEKAGYDILVKNCIAHNGGQQKMQLIDSNGCVVNERFISPFRGTYNDNDLKHVTLYSYLKAFRFTGSPVLYLECEVHMCQSACPPQMCYWRRLSKRSLGQTNGTMIPGDDSYNSTLYLETGIGTETGTGNDLIAAENSSALYEEGHNSSGQRRGRRSGRMLQSKSEELERATKVAESKEPNPLSDKISLFQALEVRQERFRDPATAATSLAPYRTFDERDMSDETSGGQQLMCYQRVEIFAFLFTVASILLAAISVTIGCYRRASNLKRQAKCHRHEANESPPAWITARHAFQKHLWAHPVANSLSLTNSANNCYSSLSSASSSQGSSSPQLSSPVSMGSSVAVVNGSRNLLSKMDTHTGGNKKLGCAASPYSNLIALCNTRQHTQAHCAQIKSSPTPFEAAARRACDELARGNHQPGCRRNDTPSNLSYLARNQQLANQTKHTQLPPTDLRGR